MSERTRAVKDVFGEFEEEVMAFAESDRAEERPAPEMFEDFVIDPDRTQPTETASASVPEIEVERLFSE